MSLVGYRHATEEDLPAEHAVFAAAQEELHQRHSIPWSTPPLARWADNHRHLLRYDGERSFVAEHDGRVVGFSAAFVRDDLWFFSALHVHPEFQGLGIGKRLFDLSRDRAYHRQVTITEAIQLASNGLYAQRGLIPVTPILHFRGSPVIDAPADLEAAAPETAAVAALDAITYGCNRMCDHGFWSERARLRLWQQDGTPVAYSYVRPDGLIGPVAGTDPATAAGALRGELNARRDQEVRVMIPGSAGALVEVALAAGLRFYTMPALLLLSPAALPPRSLAISGYVLF